MKKQKQFKYRSMKIQYYSVLQNRTERVYLFTSSSVAAGISLFKTKGEEEDKMSSYCDGILVLNSQSKPITGRSCHKYHCCRDKHVFIYVCRNKYVLPRQKCLSRQAYFCCDIRHVLSGRTRVRHNETY